MYIYICIKLWVDYNTLSLSIYIYIYMYTNIYTDIYTSFYSPAPAVHADAELPLRLDDQPGPREGGQGHEYRATDITLYT